MEPYLPMLRRTQLFRGVGEADLSAMLNCLQAHARAYKKGAYIFCQGERLDCILILARGGLHIRLDDYWGRSSIISRIGPGEMFGEAYAAPDSGPLSNDVVAVEDSTVLFFELRKLLTVCSSACRFHSMVIQNLVFAISEKNRALVQKLHHISQRTTREKLISYLSGEAKRQNSGEFTIPFNRQQLADFLSVDRSAMSSELGKMRDEGLLRFEKNRFTLL